MVRLAIAFEGFLVLLAWGLGWLFGTPPYQQTYLNPPAAIVGFIAAGPPLLAMWWCSQSQWVSLRGLMDEIEHRIIPLFSGCPQSALILICVLAGVGEEALFRGVLQSVFTLWVGPGPALVLTSVVFGLGHLITPVYAVLAGVLGFYLGWLSLVSDNLLPAMIAHGFYDYVALRFLLNKYGS